MAFLEPIPCDRCRGFRIFVALKTVNIFFHFILEIILQPDGLLRDVLIIPHQPNRTRTVQLTGLLRKSQNIFLRLVWATQDHCPQTPTWLVQDVPLPSAPLPRPCWAPPCPGRGPGEPLPACLLEQGVALHAPGGVVLDTAARRQAYVGAAGGVSSTVLHRTNIWQPTLEADPKSQHNFHMYCWRKGMTRGTTMHIQGAVFPKEWELGVWKEKV